MRILVIAFIASALVAGPWHVVAAPAPTSPFDQYGALSWNNEMARLDNFAIHLQNYPRALGFIVVVDVDGGCPGEAKARALRAKRYIVEHRGVRWNQVVWKVESYGQDIHTTLLIAPPGATVPYPYHQTTSGKDGPLVKRCQTRLQRIARSRW